MRGPVTFEVSGTPRPQGSKRAFVFRGRAVMKEQSKHLEKWRKWVALVGRQAIAVPYEGAVNVFLEFVFKRPKDQHSTTGVLKAWAPSHHTKTPDVDKLVRAVFDGLTGVAWVDDSQVVSVHASKMYAALDAPEGVKVVIYQAVSP